MNNIEYRMEYCSITTKPKSNQKTFEIWYNILKNASNSIENINIKNKLNELKKTFKN